MTVFAYRANLSPFVLSKYFKSGYIVYRIINPNEIILENVSYDRSRVKPRVTYIRKNISHLITEQVTLFYFQYYVTLKSISDSRLTAYLLHAGRRVSTRDRDN